MLLPRTNPIVGETPSHRTESESDERRNSVWVTGRQVEPTLSVSSLIKAIPVSEVELFRPLLPVGYEAGVRAYQAAANQLAASDLSHHYTNGLSWFHNVFVPHMRTVLHDLSGGEWNLNDYIAYAAGSDVDLITHVVEASQSLMPITIYPGDWFGFKVGAVNQESIKFSLEAVNALACLCVPSVRNGNFTHEMLEFLESSRACLLNINLFPTLPNQERKLVARMLNQVLSKSLISISFSRGFGLTASQLGLLFVHKDHPLRSQFHTQWSWHTYFYNAIAARAFFFLDQTSMSHVDEQRRQWVHQQLLERELPVVNSGSYYVKAFRIDERVPDSHLPLVRNGILRLCFKPFHLVNYVQGSQG